MNTRIPAHIYPKSCLLMIIASFYTNAASASLYLSSSYATDALGIYTEKNNTPLKDHPAHTFLAYKSTLPPADSSALRNPAPSPQTNQKTAGTVSLMSNREFWLSIVILIFGTIIIIIEYFLLRTVVQEKTDEIARIYTVTLIIIGTLVLISSGFTNEQIAPALGLFGTIAGYLLGRTDRKADRLLKERSDEQSR